MKDVKKTTLWDRLRNAARAFKGKPVGSISFGLEVKRCSECERGNCEGCVYKGEFERLMNLPNCHDCGLSTGNSCEHRPKLGEDIRINCPLWKPKEEDTQP